MAIFCQNRSFWDIAIKRFQKIFLNCTKSRPKNSFIQVKGLQNARGPQNASADKKCFYFMKHVKMFNYFGTIVNINLTIVPK